MVVWVGMGRGRRVGCNVVVSLFIHGHLCFRLKFVNLVS